MQQSFIERVVDEVWSQDIELENLVFVLPSRRAGTFLKSKLASKANRTQFAPEIYSIEGFIEKSASGKYQIGIKEKVYTKRVTRLGYGFKGCHITFSLDVHNTIVDRSFSSVSLNIAGNRQGSSFSPEKSRVSMESELRPNC